jgi:pSer/pThr/pTyr-binding forkhead associated (FHA) protein
MQGAQEAGQGSQEDGGHPGEAVIQVYQGVLLVKTYRLTSRGLTLGKARSNDIIIPGTQVSRVHARIIGEEGAWLLEDQGSTNGTFVYEGEQLVSSSQIHPGPQALRDQQEIRLGPYPGAWRLIFSDQTATDKSPPVYIDVEQRQVWIRSCSVHLPRDHYVVLLALYQQVPFPCSYEALCTVIDQERQARKRRIYAELVASDVESLHHLIHRLRARIEVDPKQPRLILQIPHVGYRLHNEADPQAYLGTEGEKQ